MRFHIILHLFFLVPVFISCKQSNVERPFITLDIPIQIEFYKDSLSITSFMISPMDENHLWVFGNKRGMEISFDLDLQTGSWTNLNSIIGDYANGLRMEYVRPDTVVRNLVWVSHFHKGICLLNTSTRTYVEFPKIHPVDVIAFTEEEVWIGTWRGLIRYDRATSRMDTIKEAASIHVNTLRLQPDKSVIINQKFKFQHASHQIAEIRDTLYLNLHSFLYKDITIRKTDYHGIHIQKQDQVILSKGHSIYWPHVMFEKDFIWVPSQGLRDGITRINVISGMIDTIPIGYEFGISDKAIDKDYLWFSNSYEILAVNKLSGEATIFLRPASSRTTYLMADIRYVYYTNGHDIIISNKEHFIESSLPLNTIVADWKYYEHLRDSLGLLNQHSFKESYQIILELKNILGVNASPKIKAMIHSFYENLTGNIYYASQGMDTTLFAYADSIPDTTLKRSIYQGQIRFLAQHGRLDEAVGVANEHKELLMDANNHNFDATINAIRHCRDTISVIKATIKQEDIRLWYTALAFLDLWQHVGPEGGGSTIDMAFPFGFLHRLLKKYPGSRYADNAMWLLIRTQEMQFNEGEMNLVSIEKFEQIIKAYPNSELIPEIYQSIAEAYTYAYEPDMDAKILFEAAAKYIQKIKKEYPEYAKKQDIISLDQEITRRLVKASIPLTITSDRRTYSNSDPVFITFTLTNQNDHSVPISIFRDSTLANFIITITHRENDGDDQYLNVDAIPYPQVMNFERRDSLIESQHSFREIKNIRKIARVDHRNIQSHFNFDTPGRYCLKAIFYFDSAEGAAHSEEICFTVT